MAEKIKVNIPRAILLHCGLLTNELTIGELFEIANRDPKEFKSKAKEVYRAIQKAGQKALIPLNYWNKVMEKK